MEYLTQAWGWIRVAAVWAYNHPQFWPLVLALVAWLGKPRTPAEYAKIAARAPTAFWSRWVEVMRLVGALGLDPIKAVKVIRKIAESFKKDDDGPPPPPSGPSVMTPLLVFISLCLALTQTSCSAAKWEAFGKDLLADKTRCAMTYMDLSRDEVIKKCAINWDDIDRIWDLVSQARQDRDKAAEQAAARAKYDAELAASARERVVAAERARLEARERELDEQRERAGCGGYRDGGAN